jgi:hypothetical protein
MTKLQCFLNLLGWQGGTIHQVGEALGIHGNDLITKQPSNTWADSDYMKGQYAYTSCGVDWVRDRLLPEYKGNLDFWLGYQRAFFIDKF